MAEIKVNGLEEYMLQLEKLGKETEEITKRGVYAGANIVADAIKSALHALPTDESFGTEEDPVNGVSKKQKSDLIESFGLAPIQEFDKGYISTKAGWDGYGSIKTKKYPEGIPNQMLMRSVESGTTFRKKNPVIRKTVNKVKKEAIKAMGKEIDDRCKEIMK